MINYTSFSNIENTIDTPNFIESDMDLPWSMSRNERYAFIKLLEIIKPAIALEIGTYKGGSLQIMSKYAKEVYACDIDPNVETTLKDKFDNVKFHIGDSKEVIPEIIKHLDKQNKPIDFILIDGDHSTEGVKRDIELILNYKPKKPLHVILHDSFNPDCRKGMLEAGFHKSLNVHYVEIDFITGAYNHDGLKRQMWGGFAHFVMLPEERIEKLTVSQSQKELFDTVYLHSIHFFKKTFRFLKPIYKFIKK